MADCAPLATLSGAAFPVLTGETAGQALVAGDIIELNADGKWDEEGANPALSTIQLGVALVTATAEDDSIDVCLIGPDVVFEMDSPYNTLAGFTNGPPWEVDATAGAVTVSDVTANANNELRAFYHSDSSNSGKLNVILIPGTVGV